MTVHTFVGQTTRGQQHARYACIGHIRSIGYRALSHAREPGVSLNPLQWWGSFRGYAPRTAAFSASIVGGELEVSRS